MVSEVKVQSSNYAAEFGSAGVQVNAITKGGSSEFHGTLYTYMRHYKFQANDRSNSITGHGTAEERVLVPRRQPERPDPHPGHRLQQEPRQGLLLPRHRGPAPEHRLRLQPGGHPDRGPESRRLQRPPREPGLEPGPGHDRQHPGRIHRRGHRGSQQQPGPLHGPVRPDADGPVPGGELRRPQQPVQLRVQQARAAEPRPGGPAPRLQLHREHEDVRPPGATTARRSRRPAARGGTPRATTCRARSATRTRAGRSRRT